ncbi:hypothetical protein Q9966_015177 [Columba livia]|nr:hypothetical protein Q9966_015177 [Columba livia]
MVSMGLYGLYGLYGPYGVYGLYGPYESLRFLWVSVSMVSIVSVGLYVLCGSLWVSMVSMGLYGLYGSLWSLWISMGLYGLYGTLWVSKVLYGPYGSLWVSMVSVVAIGHVPCGLICHPDREHILYPLGCTVLIQHLDTKKQSFLHGHADNVSCVVVSRDGMYVASGQVTCIGFKMTDDDGDFHLGTTSGDVLKVNTSSKVLTACGPQKKKLSMVEVSGVAVGVVGS